MGGGSYNTSGRLLRSTASGYATKSRDDIFTQNRERKAHAEMDPKGVKIREARDSEEHPNSVPIILALDVTGSMRDIPHQLIKDGLPKIMGGLIERGILDPQVLFLAIGDHVYDSYPLQISQFESGDLELDLWLTRTYLEGGGGGNGGESYGLAHYFAANHTVTDHWEKRKQKGFLITIGDEPNLLSYPSSVIKEIMGEGDVSSFSDSEILKKAQEKWDVYHILPGRDTGNARAYWSDRLGQKAVWVNSKDEVAKAITDIVVSNIELGQTINKTVVTEVKETESDVINDTPKPNIYL